MRAQIAEKMVQIRNLKELCEHTIRIGEGDLSRLVRNEIQKRERELTILKVRLNNAEGLNK